MNKNTKKNLKRLGFIILLGVSIFGMISFYNAYKDDLIDTLSEAKRIISDDYNYLKNIGK